MAKRKDEEQPAEAASPFGEVSMDMEPVAPGTDAPETTEVKHHDVARLEVEDQQDTTQAGDDAGTATEEP